MSVTIGTATASATRPASAISTGGAATPSRLRFTARAVEPPTVTRRGSSASAPRISSPRHTRGTDSAAAACGSNWNSVKIAVVNVW